MPNNHPFTVPPVVGSRPATAPGDRPRSPEGQAVVTGRILRTLYLLRAGFSFAWVIFVYSFASSVDGGATIGLLAGVFLIAYPASDAIASLVELRTSTTARSRWPHYLNMAAGFGATAGIAASALSDLATAINIFGVWAVASGAVQLYLAARRLQDKVRGQWPMIISGAGSIVAGITFIGWIGSSHDALATVAQYSAGGAVWYVLTAAWLMLVPWIAKRSEQWPRTN
jgi:uncharacterized membrane protein HdeD (DUF308 family)